jgi:cysteine desulfurase/selenocysteine lyase
MATTTSTYDIATIRKDFPILSNVKPHGKPLTYLDNAATSQKPNQVIDAISNYYRTENSNVHRGIHYLSQRATDSYEGAREKIRDFLGASSVKEIILLSGNTEALNLVSHSFGASNIKAGDEVLISGMEHHSNIVPWQMVCEARGATLKVVPVDDDGDMDMDAFDQLLTEKTKFVGVVYVSNALGTINPVKEIISKAHAVGAKVMLDSAQAAPHLPIDVQDLDCDFLSIAPHKMLGPTGTGVLFGKQELLEKLPPYKGGGDMILSVTFEKTTYNELPYKFEAGTPNIAGVVGLGAAVDYLQAIGMENVQAYEADLLAYGTEALREVDGLRMIGTAKKKTGVMSFVMDVAHPHDIGQVLDGEGIAIRAGHHCAQPLMKRYGVPATARASLALYNTREDIDTLVRGLHKVNEFFS